MSKSQSQEPCKFDLDLDSKVSQPPTDSEACHGWGALFDKTVSSIPRQADWPGSFPLKSLVELVSTWGLQPETIISKLSKQLGGRITHYVDCYEKIGTHWGHINTLKRG